MKFNKARLYIKNLFTKNVCLMKTFQKFFALAIALSFTAVTFANNPAYGPTDKLRKEVARLVADVELSKNGISNADVWINFTFDENNKIVVLDVDTENTYLKTFIKEKLNDQKVKVNSLVQNQEYNIKISFASEK